MCRCAHCRAVFVHVLGSFQVYTVPVFDMMEKRILMSGYENTYINRMVCRYLYVILVTFVAISIPVSMMVNEGCGAPCDQACFQDTPLWTYVDISHVLRDKKIVWVA